LFGRQPRDQSVSRNGQIANSKDIKTWLRDLYEGFRNAEIAMEKQRQVMIRQDLDGNMQWAIR
jgi:hypothetical protein